MIEWVIIMTIINVKIVSVNNPVTNKNLYLICDWEYSEIFNQTICQSLKMLHVYYSRSNYFRSFQEFCKIQQNANSVIDPKCGKWIKMSRPVNQSKLSSKQKLTVMRNRQTNTFFDSNCWKWYPTRCRWTWQAMNIKDMPHAVHHEY